MAPGVYGSHKGLIDVFDLPWRIVVEKGWVVLGEMEYEDTDIYWRRFNEKINLNDAQKEALKTLGFNPDDPTYHDGFSDFENLHPDGYNQHTLPDNCGTGLDEQRRMNEEDRKKGPPKAYQPPTPDALA